MTASLANTTRAEHAGAQRDRRKRWARAIAITAITAIWVLPVLWIMATAFKPRADVFALAVAFKPTLANLFTSFGTPYLLGSRLVNSLLVTAGTLAIAMPVSTLAAYAFSRFRFPGGNAAPLVLLGTQFLPPVIIVIPLFVVFRQLHLLDTRTALIVANLSFVVPYATWMIKGFFDALPLDMEEAAQIDGASRLMAMWSVVVPVAIPGIATAAIFSFVVSWNEFFYALVLTRDQAVTLPVALMSARTEQGDAWEIMATIGLFIIAPMLLISRFVQRYFSAGLVSGAVR
jgi:multiple sugar transport system permease protein